MKRVLSFLFQTILASSVARGQGPGSTSPAASQITLAQAEELLIQRNLPVSAGRVAVAIAEAARRVAGLRPNPTLQMGGEQLPVWSNISGSYPRFFSTNGDAGANPTYTAQMSQLIERGGKRQLRVEQAGALTGATKAQVLDTIRQQLLALRQAFTAALLAKANLDLAMETDRQYEETERLSQIRLQAGDIAVVDLERVRAARLVFRQAITDSRLGYAQAVRDVQTLLGPDAGAGAGPVIDATSLQPGFSLSGELSARAITMTLAELKALALSERPDIEAARKVEDAARAGTRLAEAARKRDVTVAMEYQRVGTDSAVGAIVSVPIFVFNNQRDAIAQAAAQQRLASLQVRQTRALVEADVEKAYLAVAAARQTLDLYDAGAVERARRIRETVQYSYQRGEASLLDLLDAQRTANQTLSSYNQAKAIYENAYWLLVSSVGGSF
ncbi:MAG: TolC family protein [Bryobacteraceae bacterium]